MIENEKTDCIDILTFGLNRTRDWRQKMAIKYPGYPRNLRAAECLSKLAAEATALTDDDWRQLKAHAGWASETFRDAITQPRAPLDSRTGLRTCTPTFSISLLTQNQSIAAYLENEIIYGIYL